MSVARTARRRRRQMSQNNNHLSGLGVSRRKQPPTNRFYSAGSVKKKRS
jgi:hypothetical protein